MPGRNGTGPMGQGSMTGRGLGACTGVNAGGSGCGRGLGRGRGARGDGAGIGMGMGCRRGFSGTRAGDFPDRDDKEFLTKQKEFFAQKIEAINERLGKRSEGDPE